MSATRIVTLDDGTAVLETHDYRSEFAFDDFAVWIAERLDIQPIPRLIGIDIRPLSFLWRGSTFEADWSDEHGCCIAAKAEAKDQLYLMQQVLSA